MVFLTAFAQNPAPGSLTPSTEPAFDANRLTPVIDLLRQDEAEFLGAVQAGDAARLEKLSWRNAVAASQIARADAVASPSDPAAIALRQTYVRCANAHSSVGLLANSVARALVNSAGGDNTQVLNEMERNSFEFLLKPFHERRGQCAAQSKGSLKASDVPHQAGAILPAQQLLAATPFTEADREAWRVQLAGFQAPEEALASAVLGSNLSLVESTIAPVQAFSQMIARRNHSGLSRADYSIVKECRWQVGHFLQLQGNIKDALARPEMSARFLEDARKSLEDYKESKSGCARVLKAPASSATVYLTEKALEKS